MAATQAPRPRPATPTDVSAAIEQRRRREQRRRNRVVAAVAAVLVLALALVWLVRFSPVLAAREVQVQGLTTLPREQVVQAARVPLGEPLVQVDTGQVGRRVAQLVQVAKVQVSTRLPHTVVIQVTERSLVYQRHAGGQYQAVDAQGVIFATGSTPAKGAVVAQTATVDNRLLRDVATVVASMPPALRGHVRLVQADTPDQITLQLDQGRRALWGSASASTDKAQVLQGLMGRKSATWFDVSSPQSPATR